MTVRTTNGTCIYISLYGVLKWPEFHHKTHTQHCTTYTYVSVISFKCRALFYYYSPNFTLTLTLLCSKNRHLQITIASHQCLPNVSFFALFLYLCVHLFLERHWTKKLAYHLFVRMCAPEPDREKIKNQKWFSLNYFHIKIIGIEELSSKCQQYRKRNYVLP